jgi:hypothetical protein
MTAYLHTKSPYSVNRQRLLLIINLIFHEYFVRMKTKSNLENLKPKIYLHFMQLPVAQL